MVDLIALSIAACLGALAVYVPWVAGPFKKYVLPCNNANCPHHGPEMKRRMNELVEQARAKGPPTQPRI